MACILANSLCYISKLSDVLGATQGCMYTTLEQDVFCYERMNGWVDGWMQEGRNEQTNACVHGWMNKPLNERRKKGGGGQTAYLGFQVSCSEL